MPAATSLQRPTTRAFVRAAQAPALPADEVFRLGVFRALMLGDMLCAVPALRALRAAYPQARFTLIGLPWARELASRLPGVDDFLAFPGFPGLPEAAPQVQALPQFFKDAQQRRFDLLVQLHGSGELSNPIAACCGARHLAGFVAPGGYCPEPALFARWPQAGHEIERLQHVVDALGLQRMGDALEFPLREADRASLSQRWPDGRAPWGGYVCVHPGAQLRSRRWPASRFAAVADRLAAQGWPVVLTGTEGERAIAQELQAAMHHRCIDMMGRTSLWELGALIEGAALLVCNDTSVSHIAAALGTRSVVVSCGADVSRWAPLDHDRHHVLWHDLHCRPCAHESCPTAHECARAVTPEQVAHAALLQLACGVTHVH